jgi:hypothetical protein
MGWKVLYKKVNNELVDCINEKDVQTMPDDAVLGNVDPPVDFKKEKMELWKYDPVSKAVAMKTSQELADAEAIVYPRIKNRLIKKYAGALIHPVVQGKMEEIVDLCVQMITHFANGTVPSQIEVNAWNLVVTACASEFKLLLADVTQADAAAMSAKKKAARQAEIDMKNDPAWPKMPKTTPIPIGGDPA